MQLKPRLSSQVVLAWNLSISAHSVRSLGLFLICNMRIKLTLTSKVMLRLSKMYMKQGVCSKCPTEGSHHHLDELAE